MSNLFQHHATIFWTQIYEPLSTFAWLEKGCVVLSLGGRYGFSCSPEEGLEPLLTGRYPPLASNDNSSCGSMAILDPISLFLWYRQPKCLIWATDAIRWLCFEMVGTDMNFWKVCIFFVVLGAMGSSCQVVSWMGRSKAVYVPLITANPVCWGVLWKRINMLVLGWCYSLGSEALWCPARWGVMDLKSRGTNALV